MNHSTEQFEEDGGVGVSVRRKEDERHLHGRGNFVADMQMKGLLEVAFLRSPLAHARILGIDKPSRFQSSVFVRADMPEVADIIAPSSVPNFNMSHQPPLAHGKVRFAGEPVAMAVAESRAEAEDIAELIQVEFDELQPIPDAATALAGTAGLVHDHWPDNVFVTLRADNGFEEEARKASVVITKQVRLSRQCMVPMEGKAVLAYWDHQANQLVVYSATQVPHLIRSGIAHFLSLDHSAIRVISPDVGGAFGYKCDLKQEELCIAWLAWKFRRPFRYIEDRREHLVAGANCREHQYELTAYADDRGRLLALDAHVVVDGGAYSNWPFTIGLEPGQITGNLPGPYAFHGYRIKSECVATNKPGFLPYRGVARTGVCFAIELVIDAIARKVGREPWEVRRENLVPPEAMPYRNVSNKLFDSGDYPASLDRAKELIRFEQVRERQRRGEPDGRLIGVGFATYTEQTAHGLSVFSAWGAAIIPGYEPATVRVTPDGGVELRVGLHSHGQGMETTLAQIANEILGVSVHNVRLIHGDTAFTPYSTGTYASRSAVWAGGAVSAACKTLLPRLKQIGAHLLGVDEATVTMEKGEVVSGDRRASLRDMAHAWYMRPERLPQAVDRMGLEVTLNYKPAVDTGTFTYASHACVVAVDPELGAVEILDYAIVEDCGKRINPKITEGQTYGGWAQGVGTALYEEVLYDAAAQPLTSTLADYILPGPTELPSPTLEHMVTDSPHTEFGVKGLGEGGAIAPPATIFNAVNDALKHLGIELACTPLSPRRLREALIAAQARPAGAGMKTDPAVYSEAMTNQPGDKV
ncbi:MAG: xanthine dehydrogenase family protein molybdopterin-binding subunit [Noviherbaspirillum sp.]